MFKKIPVFFQRSELAATLWQFRREFAVSVIFSMVANGLMLTPTVYMLQVFDRVMVSRSELTLAAVTLVMLFFFAVMAFTEWVRSRLLVRVGVRLDQKLNSRVFDASFEVQLSQLDRNPAQAFADLTSVRQFLTGQGIFALLDAPWTPIYIVVLFMLHPWLGVIAMLFAAVLIGIAFLSHRLSAEPSERAIEAGAHVNVFVQSKLRNVEVIESMGMLDNLRRRWLGRHQRQLDLGHVANDLEYRLQALGKFVRYTQQSLTLAAGALLVLGGELSPAAMIAATILVGRATAPVDVIMSSWKPLLAARKAFERLEGLLATHPARDGGTVHAAPAGHMRIESLQATAPGRQAPILKGLTLDFPAGTVVAIIGPSASGKSTLARALVGTWPCIEGKVMIDGESVESWRREKLGPYFGYLPQDIELFEGSIAENIARFGPIDSNRVILAAQRAGIHDMILRFQSGYDTSMCQAGSLLSGGQRQRIGLARAMYGNPSVVVLDEPNSNLDDVGERALAHALHGLKQQGTTVFLIVHRANIANFVDRILVLRDGTVQMYGPRQEVMAALHSKSMFESNGIDRLAPAPRPIS